ncbi:uncharacterized protein RCO7_10419 [Rhynchosporium graminicola]|uniref:Heterokaryon incompatibility domain-containing protein n=1 Tax=Rhynchosporium graminicola TaxID=2792576 RepID=A0A1E1L1W4_9HELO|nr:uncharacterized protein RCO7_10419 [Rhynchosporium commune]
MSSGRQDVTAFFKALGLVSRQVKRARPSKASKPSSSDEDNNDVSNKNEAIPKTLYQYTSLPSSGNHVRILSLQPGLRSEPIICHLRPISLNESIHHYEALSYAWGDSQERFSIQVDDGRLEIGQSLYRALRHLRDEKQTRLLWVDAISIDQSSFSERAKQVPLMCEIYQNARSTVCFLGPEIHTTGSMFAMLENLAEESRTVAGTEMRAEMAALSVNHLPTQGTKTKLFDEYLGDVTIVDIATRAWWFRAWTVQELMLSRNAVLMIGKYTITWENLAAAVDHGLQMQLWTHIFLGFIVNPVIVPYISMRSLMHRYQPSNLSSSGSPGADLLRLLTHCRHRESRDPRDKIYSVLGIFRATHPHILTRFAAVDTPIVEVRYERDVQVVYRNISQELIYKTNTLDVLGICPPTELSGLPSWATDWSKTERIGSPLTQDSLERVRTTHASGHSKACAKFVDGGTILLLRGCEVSTIASLSDVLPVPDLINVAGSKASEVYARRFDSQLLNLKQLLHASETSPSPFPDFDTMATIADTKLAKCKISLAKHFYTAGSFVHQRWSTMRNYVLLTFYILKLILQVSLAQYQSFGHDGHAIMEVFYPLFAWQTFARAEEPTNPGVDPSEVYWHTLCCGTYTSSPKSTDSIAETHNLYTHHSTLLSPFHTFIRRFKWLTGLFPWIGIAFYLRITWEGHSTFWKYIEASKCRRMGRLENGYLAMLPRGSELGDLVCLVGGGGVPLVLRTVEGEGKRESRGLLRVRFVGEAYVHGIMDGEGWDEVRCTSIEIE